jgi:hypothetical protein
LKHVFIFEKSKAIWHIINTPSKALMLLFYRLLVSTTSYKQNSPQTSNFHLNKMRFYINIVLATALFSLANTAPTPNPHVHYVELPARSYADDKRALNAVIVDEKREAALNAVIVDEKRAPALNAVVVADEKRTPALNAVIVDEKRAPALNAVIVDE